MDGFEAKQIVRSSRSDSSDIPNIGLKAHDNGEAHLQCMDCGMNDVISKPALDDKTADPSTIGFAPQKTSSFIILFDD